MDSHGEEPECLTIIKNDMRVDVEMIGIVDDDALNGVIDPLNDVCGLVNRDINLKESTSHENFEYLFRRKFSTLTFIVKLMQVKVLNCWSDKSFDRLFQVLVVAFLEWSNIPKTYYDATKKLRE